MADPLDHDGDGRKGGSLPKALRKPKGVKVLVGGVISDGQGGTYPEGETIHPSPEQAASLKAKGFVE